jgi:hypothetical protein
MMYSGGMRVMSSKRKKKEEKRTINIMGLVSPIIMVILTIFIGISIMGAISQEIDNVLNCIPQNATMNITQQPKGSTGSFGGAGGAPQFGGYDGKVIHKSFLSEASIIKTNQSLLDPNCKGFGDMQSTSFALTVLQLVPVLFAIIILGTAIMTIFSALKNTGLMV